MTHRESRLRRARANPCVVGVALVALAAVGCASPASEPDVLVGEAAAEEAPVDPTAVRPFEIAVPDEVLDDLQARLARTRLPDQLDGADWDYGAELGYVTEV